MSKKTDEIKRRNPLHDHPLLRKAARHEKSKKAKRRAEKVLFQREWLPQIAFV